MVSVTSASATPGATAATDLARQGKRVLLLDRAGRIKPCGGAIPPRLIKDFGIPDELLVARILEAVVRAVDVPVTLKFRTGWDKENRNALRVALEQARDRLSDCTLSVSIDDCTFMRSSTRFSILPSIQP